MTFKNYAEFKEKFKSCGIPSAEGDFIKPVNCPYITYFKTEDIGINADGKTVIKFGSKISVELYTKKSDDESEQNFEKWLQDNEIVWSKTDRAWYQKENMCITYYELLINYRK